MPRFSIIIVLYNAEEVIERCLKSIIQYSSVHEREVILVNNSSPDRCTEIAKRVLPECSIINTENRGFSHANNVGAKSAHGEILFFLNADAFFVESILEKVDRSFRADPSIGVIGPRLEYPDGRFQISSGKLPSLAIEFIDKWFYRYEEFLSAKIHLANFFYGKERFVEYVTGASLFIHKDVFNAIGGFDEKYFLYFEDKDLCARVLKVGFKCLYNPSIVVGHLKSGSNRNDPSNKIRRLYRESQMLYYSKHSSKLEFFLVKRIFGITISKNE